MLVSIPINSYVVVCPPNTHTRRGLVFPPYKLAYHACLEKSNDMLRQSYITLHTPPSTCNETAAPFFGHAPTTFEEKKMVLPRVMKRVCPPLGHEHLGAFTKQLLDSYDSGTITSLKNSTVCRLAGAGAHASPPGTLSTELREEAKFVRRAK